MKKMILTAVLLALGAAAATAQLMRAEELEKYSKETYGHKKWTEIAAFLSAKIELDKNGGYTLVQVIEAPGKSKEELYVTLNHWFTATFATSTERASIKLNDKELGTIIAQGFIKEIATHMGIFHDYWVHLTPIIKVDIKDNKVRVTYTVPYYHAQIKDAEFKIEGQKIGGEINFENWLVADCYPFTKERDSHKRTSSKALVMSYAYSNVVMDKIEETVKNGLIGNENDDW